MCHYRQCLQKRKMLEKGAGTGSAGDKRQCSGGCQDKTALSGEAQKNKN